MWDSSPAESVLGLGLLGELPGGPVATGLTQIVQQTFQKQLP